MSTVKENRLFKVRELVEKSGGGTSFALRLGVEKQYASQIAGKGQNRKGIGDAMARKIEREFGLPNGYLDSPPAQTQAQINQHVVKVPMLQIAGSNENQDVATYKEDAAHEFTLFRSFVRKNINPNDEEKLAVGTVRTDKMSPTFNKGDPVIIDVSVSRADDAGVYVFTKGSIFYINRLQPTEDGLRILCDNQMYDREVVTGDNMHKIVIHGKALEAWVRKKL